MSDHNRKHDEKLKKNMNTRVESRREHHLDETDTE